MSGIKNTGAQKWTWKEGAGMTLGDTSYSILLKSLAAEEPRAPEPTGKFMQSAPGLRAGLSFLPLLTFWLGNYLAWGCHVHWRVISSMPRLFSLASSQPPVLKTKDVSPDIANCSWTWKWGQNHLKWENTVLRRREGRGGRLTWVSEEELCNLPSVLP